MPSCLFSADFIIPLGPALLCIWEQLTRGVQGSVLESKKLCHLPAVCPWMRLSLGLRVLIYEEWRENLCPRIVAKVNCDNAHEGQDLAHPGDLLGHCGMIHLPSLCSGLNKSWQSTASPPLLRSGPSSGSQAQSGSFKTQPPNPDTPCLEVRFISPPLELGIYDSLNQ